MGTGKLTPFRIAIIFALLSGAWILFSDLAVQQLARDTDTYTRFSIIKGFVYVLLTSTILYLLVSLYARGRQEYEQHLELMNFALNHINEAAYLLDEHARICYVNEKSCQTLEYSRDELIGLNMADVDPEFPLQKWHEHWQDVKTKGSLLFESRHRTKGGRLFPVEISANYFEHGGHCYNLALVRDITERKKTEEYLQESNELFSLFMRYSPVYVFIKEVTPTESRVLQASDNFLQMVGIRGSDMLGKTMEELFPAEFAAKITADDWAVVSEGKVLKLEENLNGRSYTTIKFPIVRGQKTLLAGYTIDSTEKHELEEERLKTQKLEAIGTLAGGIAHDFNNLLQGIFGYISLAKLMKDNREKCCAALQDAEDALHQSVNLTNQLLTFSKGGKPVKKVINLRPVIENSVKFALSGSRVDYGIAVAGDLLAIEGDEGQIGQVIQNIVLNADQAMPLGGRIEVAARNVPAPASGDLPHAPQDSFVEITIRDQGTGIPPAHIERLFDPYFTTKEKGSGLGLATSYSIVRNHGGLITVSSEMGKGSVFTIYLPATEQRPETSIARKTHGCERTGRVLVMDDEEVVRKVAAQLVEALGHQVELVRNGEEALAAYQMAKQSGNPFDAVILDLTIRGGMGGLETLQKLRERDPGVKAIVSSGYSDDTVLSEYRRQGFSGVLGKPYSLEGLHTALNELMKRS